METQIVLLIALTSIAVLMNAALLFGAYRKISRFTRVMKRVKINPPVKMWVRSLEDASAQAVTLSDAVKDQLRNTEEGMASIHEQYTASLKAINTQLQGVAYKVTTIADDLRRGVERPAFAIAGIATRLANFARAAKGSP